MRAKSAMLLEEDDNKGFRDDLDDVGVLNDVQGRRRQGALATTKRKGNKNVVVKCEFALL